MTWLCSELGLWCCSLQHFLERLEISKPFHPCLSTFQPLSVSCYSSPGTFYQSLYSLHSFIHLIPASCALSPSFSILLSTLFLISSLVCLFLFPALYCCSCSPPLFLCPPLHRNNGLLTAFQLPQGLRGRDGCRMLMSVPRHWTLAAHTVERREGWRIREIRLCQSHTDSPKIWSLTGYLFQCLKSASHTSATPHTYSEVM